MKNKIVRNLGVLIFTVGVVFGVALFSIVIWGDFEAARFDAAYRFDEPLRSVRCPVIMTEVDVGSVSASFSNPTDDPVEFRIRTHISQGSATLMREENSTLPLAPGESQRIGWTVTPDDAAFGRLILARVRLFPRYPLPARDGSCGILFLSTSALNGNQIFAFILAVALLCMGIGAGLWVIVHRPLLGLGLAVTRSMSALAGCILVGMIVGLLGSWMFGGIILVITVLLVATIIGYFLTQPKGE
jgi:hypothetical protein